MPLHSRIWSVLALLTGLTFALEAVLGASGVVFVVTAVVVGFAFASVAVLVRNEPSDPDSPRYEARKARSERRATRRCRS